MDDVTLTLRGLYRGRTRGERIRAEIEDRRPRIRRAAALAEHLVHIAGDDPIEPTVRRPVTIAGIAVLRAHRIQLREAEELR